MVRLTRIYTRGGDAGETHLGDMSRVPKTHARVEAFGDVDETNSVIGVVRANGIDPGTDDWLRIIQNDLFDLGADLCNPDTGKDLGYEPLRIIASQVDRVEKEIDELNADLQPLKSFILPGGTPAAANLHLARTIARRAERLMTELAVANGEHVSDAAMRYINRLSDLLFVAARWANDKGRGDVLWVPGANR